VTIRPARPGSQKSARWAFVLALQGQGRTAGWHRRNDYSPTSDCLRRPPKPWPEQLRSILEALLNALRPHSEVAGLVSDRVLSSEAGLTVAEQTLALLRHAGLFRRPGGPGRRVPAQRRGHACDHGARGASTVSDAEGPVTTKIRRKDRVVERAAAAAFIPTSVSSRRRAGRVPEPGRLLQPRTRHADRRRHRHHGPRLAPGKPGLTW